MGVLIGIKSIISNFINPDKINAIVLQIKRLKFTFHLYIDNQPPEESTKAQFISNP